MCLIIFNGHKAKQITSQEFENAWSENPHGGGLMWVENGSLKVWKALHSSQALFNKYSRIKRQCRQSNIVIHFRFQSKGAIKYENTHPFITKVGVLGFAHNGTLTGLGNSKQSDTHELNEMFKELYNNYGVKIFWDLTYRKFVEAYIGTSKLVFLNNKNEWNIYNASLGFWRNGNWYSNHGADEKWDEEDWFDYTYNKPVSRKSSPIRLPDIPLIKKYGKTDTAEFYYGDDLCPECGHVLRSEYEVKHKLCHDCMFELGGVKEPLAHYKINMTGKNTGKLERS